MIKILDITYLKIPERIILDERLKDFEKLLFCKIFSLSQSSGYCWATNCYLADYFKVSKSCISRGISRLNKFEYINLKLDVKEKNKCKRIIYINKSMLI